MCLPIISHCSDHLCAASRQDNETNFIFMNIPSPLLICLVTANSSLPVLRSLVTGLWLVNVNIEGLWLVRTRVTHYQVIAVFPLLHLAPGVQITAKNIQINTIFDSWCAKWKLFLISLLCSGLKYLFILWGMTSVWLVKCWHSDCGCRLLCSSWCWGQGGGRR